MLLYLTIALYGITHLVTCWVWISELLDLHWAPRCSAASCWGSVDHPFLLSTGPLHTEGLKAEQETQAARHSGPPAGTRAHSLEGCSQSSAVQCKMWTESKQCQITDYVWMQIWFSKRQFLLFSKHVGKRSPCVKAMTIEDNQLVYIQKNKKHSS